MNFSESNITTSEASTNSTDASAGLINNLEMYVYAISFLLGFPTHCYVSWLIISGRGGGIASDFFNLNFSICEIGISLSCLFGVLSFWVSSLKIFANCFLGLIYTGRPLFQSLICVERYLAVVHPVTFLKYKPLRYRLMCCAVAWIICFGSCFFFIYITRVPNLNVRWFVIIQFSIFIFIQLICCLAVLRALKQSGPGERGREREEENHMKRRAFYIILITTVNMVIVYVPFVLFIFISMLTKQNIKPLGNLSLICFMLAIFIQPVLYLQQYLKFSCLCYR